MKIASANKAVRYALALSCMGAAAVLVTQPAVGAPLAAPALPAAAGGTDVLATFTSGTTDWEAPLNWCSHAGGELHLGDFSGDGRDDMLCHDTSTGHKWVARARGSGYFTGTDWEAPLNWCSHPSGELYIGDFNRDGRDDMLCHDTDTGHKWIARARGSGYFVGTDWEAPLGWCNHDSGQLHIGDFNGDGRDDMLCHDTVTGHKWVARARGSGYFTGTDWEAPLGWCNHDSGELHIGDFNRDGRDDMLCHDTSTGHKWVARARGSGYFVGTDWDASLGWCNHDSGALYIGDFNRDRRDDMLCHDTDTGYKWIAYARGSGYFMGTDWQAPLGWCNHDSGQLHIGDFNRDGRDDLLCHDIDTGYKWIIRSNLGP